MPRRREILAALALLAVLAGLLFAQVTLGLALLFRAVGKAARWSPVWLVVPAGGGLAWILGIGPAGALTGFTAAAHAAMATLAGRGADPVRLLHLRWLPGGIAGLLPGQFPAGLVLAAGVAAGWSWLDWLHTDAWDLRVQRPGLASICRQRLTTAFVRSGGVLTREGVCLGVVHAGGRAAAVSWRDAERGVLVTGSAEAALSRSGFQFAHAAVRLRKPVIAVDLAGTRGLAASLAAVCAATGAPMQVFGAAGTGYYEPLRGGDPARLAALVMGTIDWSQAPDSARMGCQATLTDLLAVTMAAPGDPGDAVLDDVSALLRPTALRSRVERVPGYHPRRAALVRRAGVTGSRLEADPALGGFLADQISGLRASALGRWLCPAPPSVPGARISLADVVRQRGVVLFTLDRAAHGRAADMVANLVAAEAADVYAGLLRAGVTGDGLAWISGCETVDPPALAGLMRPDTGLGAVLTTASPAAASRIADEVKVLVLHRLDDQALAERLGWLAGRRLVPAERMPGVLAPGLQVVDVSPAAPPGMAWSPALAGDTLRALDNDEFILVTRGATGRTIPRARHVPAKIPRRQAMPARSGSEARSSPVPAASPWPAGVLPFGRLLHRGRHR